MGDSEVITSGEFGRFRDDLTAWQGRLMGQLQSGFDGVHLRLDAINGRVRHTEEGQAAIEVKVERLESIETHVMEIQQKGCAAYEAHRALMTPAEVVEEDRPKWPRRRQVIAGGGLVAGGAVLWPAIEALAKLLHRALGSVP